MCCFIHTHFGAPTGFFQSLGHIFGFDFTDNLEGGRKYLAVSDVELLTFY